MRSTACARSARRKRLTFSPAHLFALFRYLGARLDGILHVVDVDRFLGLLIANWLSEHARICRELDAAVNRLEAQQREKEAERAQYLAAARNRAFRPEEIERLRSAVLAMRAIGKTIPVATDVAPSTVARTTTRAAGETDVATNSATARMNAARMHTKRDSGLGSVGGEGVDDAGVDLQAEQWGEVLQVSNV